MGKEGMEPPEAHEKEPITDSDPCGAHGADPDPSSAAYAKCMEEGNKPAPEGEIPVPNENAPPGAIVPEKKAPVEEAPVEEAPEKKAPVEEAPVEESASLQYETPFAKRGKGSDQDDYVGVCRRHQSNGYGDFP